MPGRTGSQAGKQASSAIHEQTDTLRTYIQITHVRIATAYPFFTGWAVRKIENEVGEPRSHL